MKNSKSFATFCLALALVFLLPSTGMTQVSTSTITGTVMDKDGLVVASAKVLAKNEATGATYETTTTSSGGYTLSALPPGEYTITATHPGFRTFTSLHNKLVVGAPLVVDARLEVGEVTEVVQVESTYEKLETTHAMLSGVVSRKEIAELPLNGGNPLNLIVLEPGLVQRTNNAAGSGTHVFGSRDRAHNVTIDGIEANESSVPNPQSNIYRLSPANVQEYRVVTHNATPEFGRNSGANVTIATRAGTNDFHGDVFYFHRNTVLNSNEWFNNAEGTERPVLLLHQFGADIGGPILKNKTFFFFSYQGNKIKQNQPIAQSFGIPSVYTATARNGIYRYVRGTIIVDGQPTVRNSPALVDPQTGNLKPGVPTCGGAVTNNCVESYNIFAKDPAGIGADPTMAAMIASFPLPNSFDVGDGLNTAGFVWNPRSRFSGPFYMGRLDHRFSDNHNIFGRFLWSKYDTTEGDLLNGRPVLFPGFAPLGEVFRTGQNLALSYRSVWSPRLVNEFTTGYSRFRFFFSLLESNKPNNPPPFGQECFGTDSLINIDTPFCNTPHTARAVSTLQFVDNLSYTVGAHSIRTGINLRFYRHNDSRGVPGGFNMSPTIIFNILRRSPSANTAPGVSAGFPAAPGIQTEDNDRLAQSIVELVGIPGRIQQAFQADFTNDVYTTDLFTLGTRSKQFNWYFQDEWKIRRNLTMTYGVRWEWNRPPRDCCDRTFVPDLAIDGSQGPVTYVKADSWFKRRNANTFAPRLSFAWDPRSNGKTVVRAGYGIAFDTISTFQVTSIGGKVPGSVLQCRVNVQSSAAASAPCTDIPNNVRLPQLLAAFDPFTLGIPASKPSQQLGPQPKPQTEAPDVGAFDPNLKVPTVHEWNLTIQRELGWGFVGQVGYVGKRGTRLYRAYNLNQIRTDQPGFLEDFLRAQKNVFICRNNATACLAAQTVAGVSAANRTVDNFANFGLPGQVNLPLLSALLGAASNTSSAFRGINATHVLRNGLGDLATRIDEGSITSRQFQGKFFPADFFRPNAQFTELFYFDSGGGSIYHGGMAQLVRRFERGLTLGLSYTFAKSIDDMSVDPVAATSGGGLSTTNSRTPTDVHNFRLDRSRSDFDNRHVIVANYLYELPFGRGRKWGSAWRGARNQLLGGWTLTGIYTYQSGEPFTLNSGARTVHNTKQSRAEIRGPIPDPDLQFTSNPSIKGPVVFDVGPLIEDNNDPNYNCRQLTGTNTFFCIPAPGQHGSGGRNTMQGPSFWNFDFGVLKNFPITEQVRLQFRTEFFNVFNHPNFENPRNATEGTPTLVTTNQLQFGQTCCITASVPSSATVIAVGEPNRVIQFSLKVVF